MAYTDAQIRRMTWHCRRGMLELDVVLEPFMRQHFRQLSFADQQCFEKLLACEDQDLFSWVMRRTQPEDADLQRILSLVLSTSSKP